MLVPKTGVLTKRQRSGLDPRPPRARRSTPNRQTRKHLKAGQQNGRGDERLVAAGGIAPRLPSLGSALAPGGYLFEERSKALTSPRLAITSRKRVDELLKAAEFLRSEAKMAD